MIPLRLADQAVEACNAEIHKLREENAVLRRAFPGLYQPCDLAGKTYEVVRMKAVKDEEEGLPCIRVTLTLMDKEPYKT